MEKHDHLLSSTGEWLPYSAVSLTPLFFLYFESALHRTLSDTCYSVGDVAHVRQREEGTNERELTHKIENDWEEVAAKKKRLWWD